MPTDTELMADPRFGSENELGERRLYVALEALDRVTLIKVWHAAHPEKTDAELPQDEVELGYGLYEYFTGC